ncbi:hypothetical protein BDZ89DRAFT_1079841 [Hymenopellis radicata]|nr:hypothetical protein BDZ89DRAFT_1079841 [Hymenopellis radicata]
MARIEAGKATTSSAGDSVYQTSLFLFGLWNTSSPFLFLGAASIVVLHLFLLPKIWPGKILPVTEDRIREVEAFLHDESARRRSTGMAIIYAQGLERLDGLKARVGDLSEKHRTLCLHRYIRFAYGLCVESRRCLRDVQMIRDDLNEEIRSLDYIGLGQRRVSFEHKASPVCTDNNV